MVMLVLGVVTAIYVMRFALQRALGTGSSILASVMNTVQITVFNMIYQDLAIHLTDAENHRTDTQYEDAMIVKLFVFQFINSFSSFFFLAFIAQHIDAPNGTPSSYRGSCGAETCMQPLAFNLFIIFGTRLTLTNFLDVYLPYLASVRKRQLETEGVEEGVPLSPAEEDFMLCNYNTTIENIKNYADAAIQYGFSMLFITALPFASFFSLVSNHVKVKFVIWKLLRLYQRPRPQGAQDIGMWQEIFGFVTVMAVVTNAGLVCFTMTVLPSHYSTEAKIWIFLGYQWVMFVFQYLTGAAVPDVPYEVDVQKERMKFVVSKVIFKLPDEDKSAIAFDEEDDNEGSNTEFGRNSLFAAGSGKVGSRLKVNCGCCVLRKGKKQKMRPIDASALPDLAISAFPGKAGGGSPNPLYTGKTE